MFPDWLHWKAFYNIRECQFVKLCCRLDEIANGLVSDIGF